LKAVFGKVIKLSIFSTTAKFKLH